MLSMQNDGKLLMFRKKNDKIKSKHVERYFTDLGHPVGYLISTICNNLRQHYIKID